MWKMITPWYEAEETGKADSKMERKIRPFECDPLDWEKNGSEIVTQMPESLRDYLEGFRKGL